jgi:threonine aldolase
VTLNFASDNTGPAAPEIMEAVLAANAADAMPYGADPLTGEVEERLRALLGWPDAAVMLVSTGTAANALALATLVRPWQTVFCHRAAHVEEDECGAPEFFSGAKLTLVEGAHGRMTPEALARAMAPVGARGVHGVQPGALSLTNVTEAGTVLRPAEIAALARVAREAGLPVHLDGARFANACAAAGCDAAEMAAEVDALCFGGTKNGALGVEAVVLRDPSAAAELGFRRKRAGHLWSKHRVLSAQMAALLRDGLWLRLAARANAAAARLARGLEAMGAELLHPAEANMIFARLPREAHDRALAEARYYLMDDGSGAGGRPLCRLVCDWSKTEEEVDRLLALLGGGHARTALAGQ